MSEYYFCKWKEATGYDSDGVYETSCNNTFEILGGNPENNGFKFCPYCAGTIVEVLPEGAQT